MKKVMFAAAVAAAGLAFGIESANTVGYHTVPSISGGQYVALGVQFESCSGGAIAVKDLVTVGSPTATTAMGGSDQIWRWNTATAAWTKYFCYKPRGGTARWVVSTNTDAETTDTIPAGEGFFFQRAAGAASATISIAAPSAN